MAHLFKKGKDKGEYSSKRKANEALKITENHEEDRKARKILEQVLTLAGLIARGSVSTSKIPEPARSRLAVWASARSSLWGNLASCSRGV